MKGHSIGNCPDLGRGFKGKCKGCGKVGHPKALCPFENPGKGKGGGNTNNLEDEPEQEIGGIMDLGFIGHVGCDCEDCGTGWKKVENRRRNRRSLIGSVEKKDEGAWSQVSVKLDSGAVATVGPKKAAPNVAMVESYGSKNGKEYRTASGQSIPNRGEKRLEWQDKTGGVGCMTMQVTDVTSVLASVSKICDAGNEVMFTSGGGFIKNQKTGRKTEFTRRGGIYELDIWVKAKETKDALYEMGDDEGFKWQDLKK